MSAAELLCHLRGAFRVAMRELPSVLVDVPMPRELLKFKALWSRYRGRRISIRYLCSRSVRQRCGWALLKTTELRFSSKWNALPAGTGSRGPFLIGQMSYLDWMRWGYVHTDHHLRQFGH